LFPRAVFYFEGQVMSALSQIVCLRCNGFGYVKDPITGRVVKIEKNKCEHCNGTGIDPKKKNKGATK